LPPARCSLRRRSRRRSRSSELELRRQIVHEIQQEFKGKVVWGEDLRELTFAGATIANIEGY
jgi:hypothetical protein